MPYYIIFYSFGVVVGIIVKFLLQKKTFSFKKKLKSVDRCTLLNMRKYHSWEIRNTTSKVSSFHLSSIWSFIFQNTKSITSGSQNQHYPDSLILLLIFNYFPIKSYKLFKVKTLRSRNLGPSSNGLARKFIWLLFHKMALVALVVFTFI